MASGSTRWLQQQTRAEARSVRGIVEVDIAWPTKHSRMQAASNRNNDSALLPRVSPRRKWKQQRLYTMISPLRQERRIARGGDPSDECGKDDSDDEVEIVVDALVVIAIS